MIITNYLNSNWLFEQKKANPDKIFLTGEENHYTFSKVYKLVTGFEHFISGKIKKNSYVPLLCENNPDFIIAIFALWQIGATPVVLNHKLRQDELTEVIQQFDFDYILLHSDLKNKFSFTNAKKIIFPVPLDFDIEKTLPNKYESTAVVLFTSGSKSRPKGVKLSFGNLFAGAFSFDYEFNSSPEDKFLASLPFYHIGGFSIITRSVLSGMQIIFPSGLKTENLLLAIRKYKPNYVSLVPTMLKRLLEKGLNHYEELKNVFVGGGPSAHNILTNAIRKQLPVTLVYGATETTSMVALKKLKDISSEFNGLHPIINVILKISDERKKELPINTKGEIVVTAPQVAQGYLNKDEYSAEKFEGNSFYTGDAGYIDESGKLFVLGRKDDIIISGGENINPAEIEEALISHPEIEDAYVFGETSEEWGEQIVAAIKVSVNSNLANSTLTEFLRTKIASFKIPKKFFFMDAIPRTALGKVKQSELKKLINS